MSLFQNVFEVESRSRHSLRQGFFGSTTAVGRAVRVLSAVSRRLCWGMFQHKEVPGRFSLHLLADSGLISNLGLLTPYF